MSNDYGGASIWRNVVRMPADGENRNGTVLDRALEDLADRTSYLLVTTPTNTDIQVWTPGALKALTVADPNVRFVRGFGWYKYESTFNFSADVPPWFYDATGLGSGAWVRCDWDALLNGDTGRTKIQPALIPQALAGWGHLTLTTDLSSTFTTTTEFQIKAGTDITDVLPGDTVRIETGPLVCQAAAQPLALQLRLVAESGTTLTVPSQLPAGGKQSMSWTYDHVAGAVDTHVQVGLWGFGDGSVAGATGLHWLRWTILRPQGNL